MNSPLVSVCVPSLNTFRFLEERIESILGQTYTNWEMIVIDSFSNDGSWEFFENLARRHERVSIAQVPRGLYDSWNRCIEKANGEYVYFATSDDTMALDCLEKMVDALEEHRNCDLAHCNLVLIDEHGATVPEPEWRSSAVFGLGIPDLAARKHIRMAPYDGLLHLTGRMVYQSITELLIRRSLFSRIGGFKQRWGSIGDLYWDMKAGLVANTVHVSDTWAAWRIYGTQGTAFVDFFSAEHDQKVGEMIREAVKQCAPHLAREVVTGLETHWLDWTSDLRTYYRELRAHRNSMERRMFQASQIGRSAVRAEWMELLRGKPKWPNRAPGEIRSWLESIQSGPVLIFLP